MAKREAGHENKMCGLTCCPCNLDLEKIKRLVRDAQYICKACGRVAADAKNLCEPAPLN